MRYPVYLKASHVPCMGLFSVRNTRKLLNIKPFVLNIHNVLLVVNALLLIWKAISDLTIPNFPTENYHFLEFPTCEQKNGEDHKGCNITLCVSNCFCHIVCFLQPFPLIGRNMSEDWNQFTFRSKSKFLNHIHLQFCLKCPLSRWRKCTEQTGGDKMNNKGKTCW